MIASKAVSREGARERVRRLLLTLASALAVTAPLPAASLVCDGATVGFDSGVPTDWTSIDRAGSGLRWGSLGACRENGNFTGGAGGAVCVSSDLFGPAVVDTDLITPQFSLAAATSPALSYRAHFPNFAGIDSLELEGSRDGGGSWIPLLAWREDHGRIRSSDGESVRVDLAPLAGSATVRLRWRYRDPRVDAFDWLAQLDDVALVCGEAQCPLLADPVADGGFEAGTWSASSTAGTSPLCTAATCGVTGARSGGGWAFLGGNEGTIATGAVEQDLHLPLGIATLRFYLWVPAASGNGADVLHVKLDGTELLAVSEADERYRSGYRRVEVPVSPYADDAFHHLSIEAATTGVPGASNFFVDDVGVEVCPTSVDNPDLTLADLAVVEGNAGSVTAALAVHLAAPTRFPVTFSYTTQGVTASPEVDFVSVRGIATIPAGATRLEIPLTVIGDTLDESAETFLFTIANVENATATDLDATVTIDDDDQTWITIGDSAAIEADSTPTNAVFAVNLSRANSQAVLVDWATGGGTAAPGADYQAASGTLSFPAGTTSATITVQVLGDQLAERDETFEITLSNPRAAAIEDPEALGRILDDDRGRVPVVGTDVVYTVDQDFDLGQFHNLSYANAPDELRMVKSPGPLPYLWVAASAKGTIVKIDTRTGQVLGEYRSSPQAGVSSFPNPSRTTVALDGSVWAGNRGDRSIVHVGLVENGECVDRNGDGMIETSGGLGDVRAWSNADGRDSDGGVETAADECILHYTRTSSAAVRHLSIDSENRLWVSGTTGRIFDLVDGTTGAILRSAGPMPCGGYGGLVDSAGIVWSVSEGGPVLRWDPAVDPPTSSSLRCVSGVQAYGLALAPDGGVWVSAPGGDRVWKIRADGNQLSGPYRHGSDAAQGLATDAQGGLWVSSAQWANLPTVGHLRADGLFLGNVTGVPRGSTGIAVDAEGKIWSANLKASGASRIDPTRGPLGADGATPVGLVDLVVPLPGASPYNYSDMTGALVFGNTAPQGSFRVVQDAGAAGATWGTIRWNSEPQGQVPAGAAIVVEARAAESETALAARSFLPVANGAAFSAVGRYIEVRATLSPNAASESPSLSDLRVSTVDAGGATPRRLYVSNAEVTEANLIAQNAIFTVTLSSPSDGTVKVSYATVNGAAVAPGDFTASGGTLTFPLGASSLTVSVPVAPDTLIEEDEFFFLDLSAPVAAVIGDGRGVGTIVDNDGLAVPVEGKDRLYTFDGEFDLGELWNVQHDAPLSDQLQVVAKTGPFPYLWIAASNRGTLVKIDTRTGEILGEYSTNPDAGSSTYPNPSRTTVALDGSVWAGNRGDGSVIHIGLVEEGQCIDRNGNGVIETSTGYNRVLAWPNPGNVNSGGGVSQALDECILHYVKVKPSVPRHVSVDRSGNVWVSGHGGTNDRVFQLIDGKTGAILRTAGPFACGGYGGVVDKNGVVWSVYWNSKVLRWDPSVNPPTSQSLRCISSSDSSLNGYGMSLGRNGDIYVTDITGEDVVWKISSDGNTVRKIPRFSPDIQGVAVDDNEQVWTASSRWSSGKTIDHLDGNTLIRVGQLTNVPTGTTGLAVDAAGKIWAAADQGSSVIRIDPTKGAVGAGGIRIGAVDLTVSLPASTNPARPLANPYNYSDMTGYLAVRNTAPLGRWRVIQDAGESGALWGLITWNGEGEGSIPAGASITVEARASESIAGLGGQAFVTVTNGLPFSLVGRFVEVRVTLRPNASGQSPVLSDLRIETVDRIDPAVVAIAPATVAEGNSGFVIALFPVTLSHPSEQEVLVDWRAEPGSAEDGVDFDAIAGTLVLPAGTTEATIEVPVRGDLLPELDESYLVDLERPVGAVLGASQAFGTIVDDDAPAKLSIGDVQVVEGDTGIVEAIFPVTLSGPAGQPVRFDWSTEDATATSGSSPADYFEASGYLIIPAGETAAQIVIEVAGDLDPEADETFRVVLSNASGAMVAKPVGVGTILDDDTALLAIDDVTVTEGDSGTTTARFTISASKPARVDATVDFSTVAESATEGVDYSAVAGTVTLPAGASSVTIDVPVVGDLVLEPDEMFRVELSNPVRAEVEDAVGRGTIVDDEQCLGPNLIVNPGAEERPEPSIGGELPGWTEAQGTTWTWRRAPADPPAYEGAASFAAGSVNVAELRQDVPVGAYATTIDDGVQRFAFRGFVRSADTVPSDLARVVVEYRDATDSFALASYDSLDVASPGAWEELVDVRPAPVGTRFVRIRLLATSADSSGTNGAAFDGLELESLRTASLTVSGFDTPEGDSGMHDGIFTLRLSCPFAEPVAVDVATADGTATSPSDYLARSGRVTLPPGATSGDFPVPVVGDTLDEPHETVHLDSTPAELNGAVLLTPRATGTIRNDDACQRTPGYWTLHPTLWPIDWLRLGAREYERPQLQAILEDTGHDMSMTLARQLIATKFNLLVGTKPENILGTVAEADAFLSLFPPGSSPKGPDKTEAEGLKNALQAYNSKLCPAP